MLFRTLGALWVCALLVVTGALVAVQLRSDRVDVVLSGSMAPTIPAGSLVIAATDPVTVGDVVVLTQARTGRLVTHRIVHAVATAEGMRYTTKGDANATVDVDPVPAADVHGRVVAHVPHVGGWLYSWRGPQGLALLVAPPVAAIALSASVGMYRRLRRPAHPRSRSSPASV